MPVYNSRNHNSKVKITPLDFGELVTPLDSQLEMKLKVEEQILKVRLNLMKTGKVDPLTRKLEEGLLDDEDFEFFH